MNEQILSHSPGATPVIAMPSFDVLEFVGESVLYLNAHPLDLALVCAALMALGYFATIFFLARLPRLRVRSEFQLTEAERIEEHRRRDASALRAIAQRRGDNDRDLPAIDVNARRAEAHRFNAAANEQFFRTCWPNAQRGSTLKITPIAFAPPEKRDGGVR